MTCSCRCIHSFISISSFHWKWEFNSPELDIFLPWTELVKKYQKKKEGCWIWWKVHLALKSWYYFHITIPPKMWNQWTTWIMDWWPSKGFKVQICSIKCKISWCCFPWIANINGCFLVCLGKQVNNIRVKMGTSQNILNEAKATRYIILTAIALFHY